MPFEEGTFTIEISSDLDYEEMVINLCFGTETFAILNCDKGIDKSEIRILDPYISGKILRSFNCMSFLNLLKMGFEKLKEVKTNSKSEFNIERERTRFSEDDEFSMESSHNIDYEKQVVHLRCGDNEFAILSCDKGIDKTEIGFFDEFNNELVWIFDYHDFMDILPKAIEKLIEINTNPLA